MAKKEVYFIYPFIDGFMAGSAIARFSTLASVKNWFKNHSIYDPGLSYVCMKSHTCTIVCESVYEPSSICAY